MMHRQNSLIYDIAHNTLLLTVRLPNYISVFYSLSVFVLCVVFSAVFLITPYSLARFGAEKFTTLGLFQFIWASVDITSTCVALNIFSITLFRIMTFTGTELATASIKTRLLNRKCFATHVTLSFRHL
jgi:hypothetical protein